MAPISMGLSALSDPRHGRSRSSAPTARRYRISIFLRRRQPSRIGRHHDPGRNAPKTICGDLGLRFSLLARRQKARVSSREVGL